MSTKVEVYSKPGAVTIYIGSWPFRKRLSWNIHDGEAAKEFSIFTNKLKEAYTKASRSNKKTRKNERNNR